MKSVLVIGGGQLARHFAETRQQYKIDVVTRKDYDLTVEQDCNELSTKCLNYDYILITAGKLSETTNAWNMLISNTVGPCSIISKLIELQYQGHIVVISSHASNWTSWPGISLNRLVYNCSKNALSNFVDSCSLAFNKPTFTTIEPPSFKTSMSNFKGWNVDTVCKHIDTALKKEVEKITLMRYNKGTHGETDE